MTQHMGELTAEEATELTEVTACIEQKLKQTFGFDNINYLCLMMQGFRVHFHVIPRYENLKKLLS